ncbi:MAG TPA: transposase family protein [Candidatus Enterococcus avicola]|uniref:Transposase family protein n=1 Tax=Candidatus Enterococcus avicola TaxID=2838561 RepID=A0A9D2F680_9ENTE|nr:transposase family protein [Candidatus Enterococcus avicola]
MLNHIRIMLQIKDKNITFSGVTEEEIKGQLTNVIHATLSPELRSCPKNGCKNDSVNGKQTFVKNGKKITTIRLAPFNYIPTVMKLEKQRYYCRECNHHWTADTSLV